MRNQTYLRSVLFFILARFLVPSLFAGGDGWQSKELSRLKAAEASQGVAVDEDYFYAIGNREIGKYRKSDGTLSGQWRSEKGGHFIHLNAGVVKDGKLYGAHSNFPGIPMKSSVEIWDTQTLKHIDSHDFGETDGSLTSLTYHDGNWYAVFAHYLKKGGIPGHGPEYSRVVEFDDHWHMLKEWKFPAELVERFAGYSSSCAGFGPGGNFYATGHDARELYVLQIPATGSTLTWMATIPVGFEGQGFAWDPSKKDVLYGISRKTHEVVITKVLPPMAQSTSANFTPPAP